ncbi:bacterial luciferase-like protein [Teratosphaeria nubilosa]|uniref:Bacterial luciferase-like protein n=1 Tax=Teratosphaeria nubilosa TaxID=161662 RepID=A0A6G1L0Y6_9PEZI|nr:bacterial luciferase-like protein [Teratosphaeria nubilosa]
MTHPLVAGDQFLLGIFALNSSSGMCITKVPERWNNSWENNVKFAKMADEAGIDFLLPLARWIGFGAWAAALGALTKHIQVVATMHTKVHNPVVVAKQIATVDAITKGRVGLNIVAGWNKPEFDALGIELPDSHEERYSYAQEWFDVLEKLWKESKSFYHEGKYFKLTGAQADPRPPRRPLIINAGGSGEGKAFATRNADLLFTPSTDLNKSKKEIAELKSRSVAARGYAGAGSGRFGESERSRVRRGDGNVPGLR